MRFSVKDLINIGIFTVLYVLVIAIFGQLGALVPITQVLGPLYIPIFAGIPFMLFLTRVKHFGMVTIMGLLVGLLILATGQSYWVLVVAIVCAPLADWIMMTGQYTSWKRSLLGYVVFAIPMIGTVVPLFFAREAFQSKVLASGHKDQAWVNTINSLTPMWMFFVMIVMIIVGAAIGAYLGRAMLKKHFERAGIA